MNVSISQELWDSYSPIRRDSFRGMLASPNSFFYRNRPPGDPQKFGPFTQEEEKQFLERIRYFRELDLEDSLWGLFAVPLRGRVGYQCSNYYRTLILEGKIRDHNYQVVNGHVVFQHGERNKGTPEVVERLQQEAFAFIKEAAEAEGGDSVPMPIRIDGASGEAMPARPRRTAESRPTGPRLEADTNDSGVSTVELVPGAPDHAEGESEDEPTITPVHYSIDPLSHDFMTEPYFEKTSGLVFDLQTWLKILRGEVIYDFIHYAESRNDLIRMTKRTFSKYWAEIRNVAF
jgi:hypothetical protein